MVTPTATLDTTPTVTKDTLTPTTTTSLDALNLPQGINGNDKTLTTYTITDQDGNTVLTTETLTSTTKVNLQNPLQPFGVPLVPETVLVTWTETTVGKEFTYTGQLIPITTTQGGKPTTIINTKTLIDTRIIQAITRLGVNP